VSLFANPLLVILLPAAAVSGVLGDRTDASIIIVIVLLSVAVNFTQTYAPRSCANLFLLARLDLSGSDREDMSGLSIQD
jgi:magnesium-transporting ATPase (P-type)